MAKKLGERAYELGNDTTYNSPFAKACKGCLKYMGGKQDDITVIVALINLDKSA